MGWVRVEDILGVDVVCLCEGKGRGEGGEGKSEERDEVKEMVGSPFLDSGNSMGNDGQVREKRRKQRSRVRERKKGGKGILSLLEYAAGGSKCSWVRKGNK